jgi:hypothetical protein
MPDCDIKLDALNVGLSAAQIARILTKWGPAVLKLVISAINDGFSYEFILEALETLGPLFVNQALHARREARSAAQLLRSTPCTKEAADCKEVCPKGDPECCPQECVDCFKDDEGIKLGSPIIQGEQVGANPLSDMLLKLLIQLLETQGPAVAQMLVDVLVKLLKDQANQTKVAAALAEALKSN